MRVLVTGASGLLGRAVYARFEKSYGDQVIGTAFSRTTGRLVKLDLMDKEAVKQLFEEHRPEAVIHCAAERRPDVAERDHDAVLKLNVQATEELAQLCKSFDAQLVYISTDYVFDGTHPPYDTTDKPNPLNFYGKSKLAGEEAAIEYGQVTYPSESSINVLQEIVMHSESPVSMDHESTRYPTNVHDVARVCFDIIQYLQQNKSPEMPNILHYSASEAMTKHTYNRSIDHIKPVTDTPAAATTTRPKNAALSTRQLQELSISVEHVPFRDWWQNYLASAATPQ
ncbi:hypothetical protein BDF19DRAFT_419497 [Syncephalis fuscata]|nr:hypothetical protein BDF19DRAFT_419497 [Syncephalis fuscata]